MMTTLSVVEKFAKVMETISIQVQIAPLFN